MVMATTVAMRVVCNVPTIRKRISWLASGRIETSAASIGSAY